MQVVPLHEHLHHGTAEQHVYALVAEGSPPTVSLLPDTPESRALLMSQPLHFWAADKTAGAAAGKLNEPVLVVVMHMQALSSSKVAYNYTVNAGLLRGFQLQATGATNPPYKASQLWSLAFSGPADQMLTIAMRDPAERAYSYAKVCSNAHTLYKSEEMQDYKAPAQILGDRSLKLKYLNPNLAFVVSGPAAGTSAGASGGAITVTFLDTITGQIIYRQVHEVVDEPDSVQDPYCRM